MPHRFVTVSAMASTQTTTDDIDGSEGATTRYFGINDNDLEIDLTDENFAKLVAAIAPFVEKARPRKHNFGIA